MDMIKLAASEIAQHVNEHNSIKAKLFGEDPELAVDVYAILPMEGMPTHLGLLYTFEEISKAAMSKPVNLFIES